MGTPGSAGAEGDWAQKFIECLLTGCTISGAVRKCKIHISLPYQRRKTDAEFRKVWKEAAQINTKLMEEEAVRRAYHGTLKPVYHKGVKIGHVREYSDTLMIFLLKARNPAKYRDGLNADGGNGSFVLNVNIVNESSGAGRLPPPSIDIDSAIVDHHASTDCDKQDGVRLP